TVANDTTAPVISAVAGSGVTTSAATITWTTNEASDSQVDYGTTATYGSSSALNASPVTAHSVVLSGLTSATTYHFRVRSSAAAASSGVTTSGATITWTTNEASDSQVDYGTTTAYGSSSALNPTPVTAHSVVLSGLTSATTYHFRVRSSDAAGNPATSGDFTF